MPTEKECKGMIFQCGLKHGVSPKLIAIRLLSEEDKHDMLLGAVNFETLCTAVGVWIVAGMPFYSSGSTEPISFNI